MKKQTRDSRKNVNPAQTRPPSLQKIVFGTYQEKKGQPYVRVSNIDYPVSEIKKDILLPIAINATVKALLCESRKGLTKTIILRLVGPELSLKQRIEKLLHDSTAPLDFRKDAITEAEFFGDIVAKASVKNRADLTKLALCTIDGESAKDFDDAVFASLKGKNIEVTVAIADVSNYVKFGSALDEEALSRGTSIYFPGHCVPMLPESLSNGLCSLKPNVKRLAISVIFEVGPQGRIVKPRILETVIKSAARLTYNQVQSFYDDKKIDIKPRVKASLNYLRTAAQLLRKNRERRGAIDFDVVESHIALDELGEPMAIHPQDRLLAHRIIEDLMVATNEVVAEFFAKKRLPALYRVHEPPDQEKLANFFATARAFGVFDATVKTKGVDFSEPKAVQKIMSTYKNSRYQEILNTLMLRSMMQARYSEQNLMHFGLASKAYLHFTSPIRRYADLMVHRQLRFYLFEKKPKKKIPEATMASIATAISQKEVRATDLERKIDRMFAATYMVTHVGKTFDALIVSVAEFGLFVRVIEHHVEGLVHIATISPFHVNYVAEKMSLVVSGGNESYMVGDKVLVKLINVNVERGHVDFELVKKRTKSSSSRVKRKNRKFRPRAPA